MKCHSVTIYVNQARDSREVFWAGRGFKTLEWEDSNAPDTAGRRFYETLVWGEHTFVHSILRWTSKWIDTNHGFGHNGGGRGTDRGSVAVRGRVSLDRCPAFSPGKYRVQEQAERSGEQRLIRLRP